MKIKLMKPDTLYGIRAYFGRANGSNDQIKFAIHEGSDTSDIPGPLVNIPGYTPTFDDPRSGTWLKNFWPYYYDKPIPLLGVSDTSDGVYWISVGQYSLDNMVLGADLSRSGFDYRWTSNYYQAKYLHSSPYGTQYSATQNAGDISRAFAFEITLGTGNWQPLLPDAVFQEAGNPWAWSGRFAYIPMIRAMFGRRTLLPVEFAQPLKAIDNEGAALLTWATAMEKNNHGFTIERQQHAREWQRVGFVGSRVTNSSTMTSYAFTDRSVHNGTYTYRLIQTDLDGTESVSNEAEVTILGEVSALPYPNPFDPGTQMLSIPYSGIGEIQIINVLGRPVRVIPSASGQISWDGKDDQGVIVAPGVYFINVDGKTFSVVVR